MKGLLEGYDAIVAHDFIVNVATATMFCITNSPKRLSTQSANTIKFPGSITLRSQLQPSQRLALAIWNSFFNNMWQHLVVV